jgi:hypothetical protein
MLIAVTGTAAAMFKTALTGRVRGGMQEVPLQVW